MTPIFGTPYGSISTTDRGRMQAHFGISVGAARLPTDPLFYAALTLNNIVAGSRYRVTRHSNGAELAIGLVAGSGLVDEVITGIPCFSNPMQVDVAVRQGTAPPKYQPFSTSAFMVKAGSSAYIAQVLDHIA